MDFTHRGACRSLVKGLGPRKLRFPVAVVSLCLIRASRETPGLHRLGLAQSFEEPGPGDQADPETVKSKEFIRRVTILIRGREGKEDRADAEMFLEDRSDWNRRTHEYSRSENTDEFCRIRG